MNRILIGISGGIAAYKIPSLIRLLKKTGAEVKVVITQSGLEFVTQKTLETLTQNNIYFDMFSSDNEYSTEHIALTDWADLMILAPATANIIGKLANGIADDALSTTLLAFSKPLFICPSMNCKMYEHFSVQKNLSTLKSNDIHLIEPAIGDLACGYEGKGRMEEPENIVRFIENFFQKTTSLTGKSILVTAGPTYEKIDAVRYIGNFSTGLMGFSIAETLANRGAKVTLIAGPTHLTISHPNVVRLNIESAQQMYELCEKYFPSSDAAILSAAVADFSPKEFSANKIKKSDDTLNINLVQTKDILASLGQQKKSNQKLVGFALETESEIENAKQKLKNKNLDFIVLNSLNDEGAGFAVPTNKITILDKEGNIEAFELKSKKEAAIDIVEKLSSLF